MVTNDINISHIICKKCMLKSIVKDESIIDIIKQKVLDYNYTTILVYQLIKSYWLYQYQKDPTINIIINRQFITMCFNLLSISDNRGAKIQNNDLIKSLQNYYQNHFIKTMNNIEIKSLKKTRFIKQYQINAIMTAIENNIKFHFEKRLLRYLESVFINDNMKTKEKDKITKELKIVKRDLIHDTRTIDKYSEWIDNKRNKLLPTENYYETIDKNPLKILNYMFYMNNELEKMGNKLFNCLPLRNESIPKYITIDTAGLIDLTTTKGVGDMLKDVRSNKIIWDNYFRTNKKIFKNNKSTIIDKKEYKYRFNGMIMTDGVGVSILLELVDKDGNELKRTKTKTKKSEEFRYFNELKGKELEEVKNGKKVYIDPGKRNLICCIDDCNNSYIYRNRRRISETKGNKYMRIMKNEKVRYGIKDLEEILSQLNGKTCNYEKFLKFVSMKNKLNKVIMDFYERELFRKLKFRSFTLKQRSESKMVNELNNKYGSDAILMYGDQNVGPQMKRFISTPMVGLKRMLSKHFKLYEVDEFRTSKLDHKTKDEKVIVCKNGIDRNNKKIHGVLVSKILVKDCVDKWVDSFSNRDINGCKNIRKIVLHGLENEMKRPYWYRRSTKLRSESNPKEMV